MAIVSDLRTARPKAPVFSVISLVAGIVGVVGLVVLVLPFVGSVLALFVPLIAVLFGLIGRAREPLASPRLWLTGTVLGVIGLFGSIAGFLIWAAIFNGSGGAYT